MVSTNRTGAVRGALEAVADPERAPAMAAYMKDNFAFLGVAGPQRKAAQRSFVTAAAVLGPDEVLATARALWDEPERELQYVACDLLRRVGRRLPADALDDLRDLVTTKSWWDTVDALARVVGDVVRSHPEQAPAMTAWVHDDDMWVARVAILHQLGWKAAADPEVVFALCVARIDDGEFFIRKAIGWALRDLARSFPDDVWTWVDSHPELSNLSRREATKHRPTGRVPVS